MNLGPAVTGPGPSHRGEYPPGSPEAGQRQGIKGQYVVLGEGVSIGEGTSIWNLVYIGSRVTIGSGVTIASLVHIASDVTIGDGTMIEGSTFIASNSRIGRDCFIGPGVVTTDDPFPPVRRTTGIAAWPGVTIEDGAIVCAGARIKAGVVIGRRAVVGMGAVVIADVPPETVVIGVPARSVYSRQVYDQRQMEAAIEWRLQRSSDTTFEQKPVRL